LVPKVGLETTKTAEFKAFRDGSRSETASRDDVSTRSQVDVGPSHGHPEQAPAGRLTPGAEVGAPQPSGSVEDALPRALERASAAGEWAVVATLAGELQARRLAAAGVPVLDARRGGREGRG
jgi:hypothetical protein